MVGGHNVWSICENLNQTENKNEGAQGVTGELRVYKLFDIGHTYSNYTSYGKTWARGSVRFAWLSIIGVMRLERVELKNFRSYKSKTIKLGNLTVLLGPNGAGKTNVLEAIHLLSTGESLRAGVTEEMITWGAEIGQVTGIVQPIRDEFVSLTVVLTPGVYMGKRTTKRRYLVDGAARTKSTFVGRLVSVLFRPEDLRLIEGSPGRRRQFLDEILSQSSREYARSLTSYERALRRRNKVLDQIREGEARREQLRYWDQAVIKNGNILTDYRREFLAYLSGVETEFGKYQVEYDASTISEARLVQYAREEVAAGYTLVGPHKDDFVVRSKIQDLRFKNGDWVDLHKYGSRGEQRLGVLFLKLASMRYLEDKLSLKPVLMLDDIFSELDEEHRREVVKMVAGRQTIITTAEEDVLEMLSGADIIRLENPKS